jgi:hypothetical protein
MQRLHWTALGAAGLFAGATVGGFTLVSASASDRALRGVELQDVVNAETGEPRAQWVDGSVDSATGLPTPRLTLPRVPAASPVDTDDSPDTNVAVPAPRATSAPAATAQPKATAKPKPVASADSSASTASVASADSTASVASADSTASVASADSSDSSD